MNTKRKLFCGLFIILSNLILAQDIEVNNSKLLTLIFPSNVVNATVGSNSYSVEYNVDNAEPIIFLKAKLNAEESNLIVKTEDNTLYNFTLKFSKAIPKNSIIISSDQGINLKSISIKASVSGGTATKGGNVKDNVRENDYTIGNTIINDSENRQVDCSICPGLMEKGKKLKRITSSKYDVKLDLESVYYYDSKIYVIVNMYNLSNVDYFINYIKTYIQQQKESESSSAQYLEMNPIQIYNSNRVIKGNKASKMIFIYNQFTIDNNKNLVFELNEANGERNLNLKIPNYIINKPTNVKIK
jgi:hypothetical protein